MTLRRIMDPDTQPIRVRFAPSPTGHMHLGSARTALYDYLTAKRFNGKFILRIEDTDMKRYMPEAEQELIDGLRWLGIEYDEGPDIGGPYGPYRQSERKEIYQEYAQKLIDEGKAYRCFCSGERLAQVREEQLKNKLPIHYDGTCRNLSQDEVNIRIANGETFVIRFKSPQTGSTNVKDLLRGEITVENSTLGDFVLLKSDGWALYHLAAMVDDYLMKITHVIRGSEWLPSLPMHSLVCRAFGWQEPVWIHLSVFLKPSGKGKMSKREKADLIKDGHSIFIKDLKDLGYIPEGVVNWIALMGWSLDDKTEFFTMKDLEENFNLDKLNPSPAAINFTKLDYFNGLHIRNLSDRDLAQRLLPFFLAEGLDASVEKIELLSPILKERLPTLDEAIPMAAFFFKEKVEYTDAELIQNGLTAKNSISILEKSLAEIELAQSIDKVKIEPILRTFGDENGFSAGQVFGTLRVAITGQRVSPPLFESMEIIGYETVLARIRNAITQLA
jgi:glutamyl-tRNA synthetase